MAEIRQRRPVAPPEQSTEAFPSAVEEEAEDETILGKDFKWSSWQTWPMWLRFAPAWITLLIIGAVTYWDYHVTEYGLDMRTYESCVATFNYTYRINAARHQAEHHAVHSWEYGTTTEAVLELVNPERAVFAGNPFPNDEVEMQGWKLDQALIWVYQNIATHNETLFPSDDFSATDPASLGIAAVMVGRRWDVYMEAAERQKEYLLQSAPRYINSAISHRRHATELWSDAISMFPPFLAYYGVHKKDFALLKESVRQIQLYRDVLSISKGPTKGLWKHVVGPAGEKSMADEGPWSTGNGWAAHGMARLDRWIGEILDAAIATDDGGDESGLLRNYLGQGSWFGETSGTALLTATTYRMAVLNPSVFAQPKYLDWAHAKRATIAARVDDDGFAPPAVNPLKHSSRDSVRESPEGAAFLLMMGAAWRDCVCKGICDPADQGQVDFARPALRESGESGVKEGL
ncbi:hypothetical protein LTR78_000272 [Recurvomyces mirabilis]|uniref:Uncharacterized protein n=1 Tax=Recurvomyces mirabilis TaxID=574656 RepID=A0AAE1C6B1_9PEZI|nr:hypothetical protein LTR78_000272 [Recurvomyces mirabilis]KAK5161927.1 hypothetical protein LTS14_000273 [Recurvomyces mirabilis]